MPTKIVLRAGFGVAILGATLVAVWVSLLRQDQPVPAADNPPVSLEGRWRCVGQEVDGKPVSAGLWSLPETFSIDGDTISAPQTFDGVGSFSLPTTAANAIDIRVPLDEGKTAVVQGIFSLEGDTLRLRLPLEKLEDPRPTGFETRSGDGTTVYVLERMKPGEARVETASEQLGSILWDARHDKLDATKSDRLAARCLRLAEDHPGSQQAIVALLWVLANAPDGPSGKAAWARLKGGGIAGADLDTIAMCTGTQRGSIGPGDIRDPIRRELAPLLLARVRRTPDHPEAAAILCTVCNFARDDAAEVSPVFDEAARMIAERWAKSPDISHFLQTLSAVCQRPWASRYEATVRTIRDQSPDSYMRHRAAFTLAKLVAEMGESRQEEARELYIRFVKQADPSSVDQSVAGLVEEMVEQAKAEIDARLIRGIGGPAPELKGVDLDGKPMELSQFRGKVVLLSFWATWCGPCMKLIPHERALHEQYKERPFALVGVNGDEIEKLNRKLLEPYKITWRSFQNERPKQKAISHEWNVAAWPTLYIIDHTGKIRRRWNGTPPQDELDREVERWVAVAEGKPLAPVSLQKGEAEPPKVEKGLPAKFIDKVHTDKQTGEFKYAICIPENYDSKMPLPVVLFLHGSGQVGTDNKKQLQIGLGPAIRKNGMSFPFIGVFPQAQAGSWLADSADGKRSLAILAAVEREFATDPNRVYLTGVSMGGEGVWSLAAAHPKRFAAIVPVCGGGDSKHAETLKNVPCWAFHGDADKIVPVQATREIVQAITKAGGRPQYQEYRGIDHNCWDRVYSDAEMYRWLQAQVLK